MAKLLKNIFIVWLLLAFNYVLFSQNNKIDSLKYLLQISKKDTSSINLIQSIARNYLDRNLDSAIVYAEKGLALSKKLNDKKREAKLLNELGYINLYKTNYQKSISLHLEGLKLQEKIGDRTGSIASLEGIGFVYDGQKNYEKALEYYQKALIICKETKDEFKISKAYNYNGGVFYNQKKYDTALVCFTSSLPFFIKYAKVSEPYRWISHIYEKQNKLDSALKYAALSLNLYNQENNLVGKAEMLNSLGVIYKDKNQFQKAIQFSDESFLLANKLGIKDILSESTKNLSICYSKINDFKNAYKYQLINSNLKDSLNNGSQVSQIETKYKEEKEKEIRNKEIELELSEKRNSRIIASIVLLSMMMVILGIYLRYKSKQKTNKELSLKNEKITNAYKIIEEKNSQLSETFKNIETVSIIGQKITATLNLNEVIETLHKHLTNVMDATGMIIYIYNPAVKCLEMKYTIGKHKDVISNSIPIDSKDSFCIYSLLNKKEILINDVSKEYSCFVDSYYWSNVPDTEIIQAFINIPLIIGDNAIGVISVQSFKTNVYTKEHLEILKSLGAFMSGALNNADAFSLLNKAKENLNEQKKIIEHKHKEITDSINYAERIQKSFLATDKILDSNLNDYFVFFQPKDIVSGDFYWANKLSNGNFIIATADSTGHGVPGAIMSILNISCLENSIEFEKLIEPAEILNHTRTKIIERLKKDGSLEGGKDGMDASLISFDFKNNKLTYSAANNPVWIVRDQKIIELGSDKMPIGKHDKENISFTQHNINLQKNDVVYTLTDGMPDQFGGPKGKKFMYKQLKDLLISISTLPMLKQKEVLMNTLNEWKGDLEQVDDICLIGVRV